MPGLAVGRQSGWPRAIGLMFAAWMVPVVNPAIVVAIPLGLLSLFLPPRPKLATFGAVLIAALVMVGIPSTGLWYVERGWALILGGWFLAITLRWPGGSFISKGIAAVGGTFAAMILLFWSRPGQWAVVDWAVTARLKEGMAQALSAIKYTIGPEALPPGTEARMMEFMALQGMIFPALLGLASLAALGTAWWLFLRISRASQVGIGPLKEFRFNDQLVWVLIAGVLLLLGSSGFLERMGTNAVVFMGTLYALRGVGVLLVVLGGPTVSLSLLFVFFFIFAAPLFLTGAFVFGLGDTWLNLRVRWGPKASE